MLVQKVVFAFARGAIGYTWYNLRDAGFNSTDPEHNFGLLTNDFQPKFSFAAYHHLMRLLGDAELTQIDHLGNGRWGFTADLGDHRATVLWTTTSEFAGTLALEGAGRGAELRDTVGAALPLTLDNGRALLPINYSPVFLITRGPAPTLVPLASVASQPANTPGKPTLVDIDLTNPDISPRTFSFTWNNPTLAPVSFTVPAGAKQRIQLTVPGQARPAWTTLMVDFTVVGTPWKGQLPVVVRPGLLVGHTLDNRAPDVVLEDRYESLVENDPNSAQHRRTGPQDLSGKMWLAVEGDHLRVRIDVTDDVHRQTHPDAELWKGDSVQIGFAPPEGNQFWELALARRADGTTAVVDFGRPFGKAPLDTTLQITPIETGLRYNLTVSLASLELTGDNRTRGFRVNALINDDDGGVRAGWLEMSPGIGRSKTAAEFWSATIVSE